MFIYYRICNNNFSLGSNNRFTEICAVLRLTQRLTTCISCICSTHLVLRFNLSLHANLQVYTVCLCVPTHPGSLRSWIWCYVDKTHLYTGVYIFSLCRRLSMYMPSIFSDCSLRFMFCGWCVRTASRRLSPPLCNAQFARGYVRPHTKGETRSSSEIQHQIRCRKLTATRSEAEE